MLSLTKLSTTTLSTPIATTLKCFPMHITISTKGLTTDFSREKLKQKLRLKPMLKFNTFSHQDLLVITDLECGMEIIIGISVMEIMDNTNKIMVTMVILLITVTTVDTKITNKGLTALFFRIFVTSH